MSNPTKCPFCGEPNDGSGDNPTTYQCGTWMFSSEDYARSPACLESEIKQLRGAMQADDARLLAATTRLGLPPAGCDTADVLADEIESYRSGIAAARKLAEGCGDIARVAITTALDMIELAGGPTK